MRLKEVNYFGFDHAQVNKRFGGELTYLRTFTIRDHWWAVYKAARPDREKGHKDYMMLCTHDHGGNVSGSTPEQMEIERRQSAVLCHGCDTVLYSINRHHFHKCGCDLGTFVDGGKDYMRYGGANMAEISLVTIDLIDGTVVEMGGTPLTIPIKLDTYHYSENPEAKPLKPRKPSHRSENKKRLTTRRKSGTVKSKKPRSKKS